MGIARNLANMPRRSDDEVSGELRISLFVRDFGKYPKAAINFLHDAVRRECKFFPDAKICFDILDRWERCDGPAVAQRIALLRANRERQARFDDTMTALKARALSQAEIDALPAGVKRAGETHGYLWCWPNGSYTVRKDTALMSAEELEQNRAEVTAMRREWISISAEMTAQQPLGNIASMAAGGSLSAKVIQQGTPPTKTYENALREA